MLNIKYENSINRNERITNLKLTSKEACCLCRRKCISIINNESLSDILIISVRI